MEYRTFQPHSLESSSSTSVASSTSVDTADAAELCENFQNFKVLESNDQIRELQTILRDQWEPIDRISLVHVPIWFYNFLSPDLQQETILCFMLTAW